MDSKEYSWNWITADTILTQSECELVYVSFVVGAANNTLKLYNGVNSSSDPIMEIHSASRTNVEVRPAKPIFCSKGLFADFSSNVVGAFIQWKNLGHRGEA